jgi:hypothetical protein
MAMLLVYPLMVTATAVDVVWALFFHDWLPPAVYTAGVTAVAAALATSTHLVRQLPRAASVLTLAVSVVIANTALVMTADALARAGRSFPEIALAGCGVSLAAVVLTALVGVGAESVVRRPARRTVTPAEHAVGPTGVDCPLPTLVDLISPTLVEAPAVVNTSAESQSAA